MVEFIVSLHFIITLIFKDEFHKKLEEISFFEIETESFKKAA